MKQLNLFKKRKRTPGKKWGRPITTHTGARRERESFKAHQPLHITLRLRDGLPKLRCKKGAQLIKHAIIGAHEAGVSVVHFAILSNHVHLIVEARDPNTLFSAMKSFCCRLGIHLRRWCLQLKLPLHIQAGIFRGRYHVQVLKTPRQVKHAIRYVLLNPAKHFRLKPYLDKFSSAVLWDDWRSLIGHELYNPLGFELLRERLRSFIFPPSLWLFHHALKNNSST